MRNNSQTLSRPTHVVVYCPRGHANLLPPRVFGQPHAVCRCGETLKYMSPSRKPG